MNLYIYNKTNNEFYKMDVPVEKETSKIFYFDKAVLRHRLNDLELGLSDQADAYFRKVINDSRVYKDVLPLMSLGQDFDADNPSRGAMYVLSATEMSMEEIKSLWSRAVNNHIARVEQDIVYMNEALSKMKQLLANVNDLDETTDLDNEDEERDR